jgi:DHA1 family multidrug resistance protein-like MFS transporter
MDATHKPFPWKRNLVVLWVAQIVTTLGFSFTFPFYPMFFGDLGVEEVERAAFLAGISGWMLGFGMGIFAPFWGIVGDRFGRRINIVRAMLLGAIFLILSGYSQNPAQLVISRFFIGATSGVVPAIMTLVAVHTPRERLPFATGLTQSALFMGTALGPLLGGLIFDAWGMRAAFWATGLGLLGAAGLVVAFARENFEKPKAALGNPLQPFVDLAKLAMSASFFPLLALVTFVSAGILMLAPVIAGIVETAEGGSDSATATGVVFMSIGISSAVSSVVMGWLAGRIGLRRLFIIAAVLATVASAGPFFVDGLLAITALIALAALFQGGLLSLVTGMIALGAPTGRHGSVFGASQSAHSIGLALGPLVGGSAAVAFGLKSVFLVNVGVFGVVLLVAVFLLGRSVGTNRPIEPELPVGEKGR